MYAMGRVYSTPLAAEDNKYGCLLLSSLYFLPFELRFIHPPHFLPKIKKKQHRMLNKFTTADKLLMIAALLSLIFSETLFFQGQVSEAIFIGLWVPSILGFGIYLKLINNSKND